MSFMELANNRQSDRTFSTQEVNRKDLLKCVQAAQLAPSACNSQPWKFIIIDNQTLLQQAAAVIEDNPMKINKFAARGSCAGCGSRRTGVTNEQHCFQSLGAI